MGCKKCIHNVYYYYCKKCPGPGICEHNRKRSECKDCGGSSICEHNRIRYRCKDCGGSSICEHNRIRQRCKDCGGSGICEHNKQRHTCKECNDALEITIKNMIKNSRKADKNSNRNYQESDYISVEFLTSLINNNPELTCYHCDIKCQYLEYNPTLITIERLDNSLAHIKTNCVLACLGCNHKKLN